jgi:hypothetical protein
VGIHPEGVALPDIWAAARFGGMGRWWKTCKHYQGTMGHGTICGIFPYGPTGDHCPDHEQGPRYTRRLDITHDPDPTTPPAAVVEAQQLAALARNKRAGCGGGDESVNG